MEVGSFVFEIIPLCSKCSEGQVPGKGQHHKPNSTSHHEVVNQYKHNGTRCSLSISTIEQGQVYFITYKICFTQIYTLLQNIQLDRFRHIQILDTIFAPAYNNMVWCQNHCLLLTKLSISILTLVQAPPYVLYHLPYTQCPSVHCQRTEPSNQYCPERSRH